MIYNGAYSGFAGGRHPELLGARVREGWSEVADFNDHVMKTVLAGGTLSYQDQELTLHRSGQPEQVWMNLDYSPVVAEDGSIAGVIAIVVATTAKVGAERRLDDEGSRLRESEARFRTFAQAMPNQVWAADAQGRLDWVNEKLYAYTGHGHAELVGDGWGRVVHPGDLHAVRARWQDAVATGAVFEAEVRLRRHDGSYRWR